MLSALKEEHETSQHLEPMEFLTLQGLFWVHIEAI